MRLFIWIRSPPLCSGEGCRNHWSENRKSQSVADAGHACWWQGLRTLYFPGALMDGRIAVSVYRYLSLRCLVLNCFGRLIPVLLLARPISLRSHDANYGVGEAMDLGGAGKVHPLITLRSGWCQAILRPALCSKRPAPHSLVCFSAELIRCACQEQAPCQLLLARSCLPERRWLDVRCYNSSRHRPARICIRSSDRV